MKRLVIGTMIVLMAVSVPASAGSWDGIFGDRRSGSIVGVMRTAGDIWKEQRALNVLEKEQDYQHEQDQQRVRQNQTEKQRLFEWGQQAGRIQHLKDENERLRKENAELKKQLDDMQKRLSKMEQMLQKLLEAKGGPK